MHRLILLIFLIYSCATAQNEFNSKGERSGIWFGYHDDGGVKYSGEFIDGKESGIFKYYDYNGNLVIQLEYVENGAIYMFKPEIMLNNSNRFGGDIGMIPNKFWQSFEIDEKDDWEFVELIFKNYLLDEYNKRMMDSKVYESK